MEKQPRMNPSKLPGDRIVSRDAHASCRPISQFLALEALATGQADCWANWHADRLPRLFCV